MNVQLYAYDKATRYELDLYKERPIKITLSAEEITDPTRVNSTFSRQFRIPATAPNSRFFSWWYTSGVIDFDVTQKVTADIYVDGIRYSTGQLRLVAAYKNDTADRIDFEVVFLGETKTFSSQIGDDYMSSIDTVDTAHLLNTQFVENSWDDNWDATTTYRLNQWVWYPDNAGIGRMWKSTINNNTNHVPTQGSTQYWDWNNSFTRFEPQFVRYIVADRGADYDDNGAFEPVSGATDASEVAVDTSAGQGFPATHNKAFTKNAHPLYISQFTPIIQVKYLVDKLFAETSYEYTPDSVFNEDWFKTLYIDGIASGFPFVPSGNGLFFADKTFEYDHQDGIVVFPNVEQNNANAYDNTTGIYTIPSTGTYTFEYEITGKIAGNSQTDEPEAQAWIANNGFPIPGTINYDSGPSPHIFQFTNITYTGVFFAGDKVSAVLNTLYGEGDIFSGSFQCTTSPSQISVSDLLKTDLKKIDWFRSILTKFRMVMVPVPSNPTQFTVKPWQEYVAQGEEFDWTYKLDHNKDIKLEPLFYDQQGDINFIDQEDVDVTNKYQQDTFGQPFGTRRFVSGNELLSGTREVTTEFAPTPVSQIVGLRNKDTQFIIPKFYEQSSDLDGAGRPQKTPIIPVCRLLFWNGLSPTTTNTSQSQGQEITWYYTDGSNDKNSSEEPLELNGIYRYPRASYLTDIPTLATTVNLNWNKQYAYYSSDAGTDTGQNGKDVFTLYWKDYIDSQFSPQARKMTAYFNLDNEDLRTLTFDDVVFIKDAYWRIQKVYDAPLGEVATVKVELIKLLKYK